VGFSKCFTKKLAWLNQLIVQVSAAEPRFGGEGEGGRDSYIKRTGVLIRNFEKNP